MKINEMLQKIECASVDQSMKDILKIIFIGLQTNDQRIQKQKNE